MRLELIATATFGLEAIVRREVEALGYKVIKTEDGKVTYLGDERAIVRSNLWLRSADRVLLLSLIHILDEIFGADNFINEVVWTYKSGGANKRSFARKHDNLLFYAKGKEYLFKTQKEKSYNRELSLIHI